MVLRFSAQHQSLGRKVEQSRAKCQGATGTHASPASLAGLNCRRILLRLVVEARHLRVRHARTLDVLLELRVHLGTSLNPYHFMRPSRRGRGTPD